MDKQMLTVMFDEKEEDFTGEEIAVFKRYIEENVASTDNNFEFLEENLAYYSTRYTSEYYFSPAELFHVNAGLIKTDEMKKNMNLYQKSIDWHSSTVHPQDSEYVLKKEKYMDINDFPEGIKDFVAYLNQSDKSDFYIMDLLIYFRGNIYQYLPQKDFLFKWKSHAEHIAEKLKENHFFSLQEWDEEVLEGTQPILYMPIFTPIRQMLFLGEFGYRNGMIQYGKVLEKIHTHLQSKGSEFQQLNHFEHSGVHDILLLDGVERSIMSIFIQKGEGLWKGLE